MSTATKRKRRPIGGPDDPAHGSSYGYCTLGCRCDRCREWQRLRSSVARGPRRLAACQRCGVVRQVNESRETPYCRDCRGAVAA